MSDKVSRDHADLMALAAHEVRNPLSAALANLAFLSEVLPKDGDAAEALRDAEQAVSRVRQLIDDTLLAAQQGAGVLRLTRVLTPLEALLSAVTLAAQPDADQRRVIVSTRCEDGLAVHADPLPLSRAIEVLVEASLKWTRPHGRVLVGAERRGDDIAVFVAHDAPSLEGQPHLRAFADATEDSRPATFGFPLYYARCVAHAHGATLLAARTPQWPTELSILFRR